MRPIIFVRVADMKYYKGITEQDKPVNGGSYVKETGFAHECYNFDAVIEDGCETEKCLGFFMMTGKNTQELHIEKMPGCSLLKEEEQIMDVNVVFVSKAMGSKTMRVVGFYKNAIAYRHPHYMSFENDYEQEYLFEAEKNNCVVLPYSTRFSSNNWYVPSSTANGSTFGFGRANVWYAGSEGATQEEISYVEKIISSIDSYAEDNWINRKGE